MQTPAKRLEAAIVEGQDTCLVFAGDLADMGGKIPPDTAPGTKIEVSVKDVQKLLQPVQESPVKQTPKKSASDKEQS